MASFHHVLSLTAIASLCGLSAYADNSRLPAPNPILRPVPSPITRPIPTPITPVPVRPIPPIHRPVLAPIHVDPNQTVIKPIGQPVLHRPYLLKDPSTGNGNENNAKLITPDTILTLPNNHKLTAGQYYEELNKFERHVNQYGYTLRKRGSETIPFVETPVDRAAFQRKAEMARRSHDPRLVRPVPSRQAAETNHRIALGQLPELNRAIDRVRIPLPGRIPPVLNTFHASKTWSDSWGWSNKFAAYLDTHITVDGTATDTHAVGDGNGGGFIFGNKLNIVHGTSNYDTPKDGNVNASTAFYFLGYKLYGKDYNSSPVIFYHGDDWQAGLDESTKLYFSIGPIPMSATIGAQGNATLDFRMNLLPLHANVDLFPGVNSKVYIQVGVDVVVGGAGGGSDLVLLNDTLNVQGSLQINSDSHGPYFNEVISADNEMTTLAGRVYAYVFVYVPAWSIPPWEKKQWDWTIFQLGGITANGSIFSETKRLNLL